MTQSESVLRRKLNGQRVGRAPIRGVEAIGETFAKLLDEKLRGFLRTIVGAIVLDCEVRKLSSVLEEIAVPAMIGVISVDKSKNAALVDLSGELVYHIVDLRMGGDPEEAPIPIARSITALDCALCEDVVEVLISTFEAAMRLNLGPGETGKMRLSHFEQHVTMVRIAPEHSDVLVLRISLDIGEAARSGEFSLVLPLSVLDAFKASSLPEKEPAPVEQLDLWATHMAAAAAASPVRMTGVLTRLRLSVKELEALDVGSVLELGASCRDSVELAFEDGRVLATGRLGARDGSKAIKIVEPPDREMQERLRALIEVAEPIQ